MRSHLAALADLIVVLGALLHWQPAAAFVYPSQATHPNSELSLDHNLFDSYARELDQIDLATQTQRPRPPRIQVEKNLFREHRSNLLHRLATHASNIQPSQPTRRSEISLNAAELTELLALAQNHPVLREDLRGEADLPQLPMGYCFGRAAYLHLELLRRQVPGIQIAKLFALGHFLVRGQNWDFHVATLTLAKQSLSKNEPEALKFHWQVLDPSLSSHPLSPEKWMEQVQSLAAPRERFRVRFYFSDPIKFHPLYGAYQPNDLFSQDFGSYFRDLAKWFDQNPLKLARPAQLIWSLPSIKN